jgi:hypothetical protein
MQLSERFPRTREVDLGGAFGPRTRRNVVIAVAEATELRRQLRDAAADAGAAAKPGTLEAISSAFRDTLKNANFFK